jgi:hypothetical protein
VALREENRLRVFEDRVLRRIFGPKRDEIIGSRRKSFITCVPRQVFTIRMVK